MNFDDLAVGWREALIGVVLLLVLYIFLAARRLRRLKPGASTPETPAAAEPVVASAPPPVEEPTAAEPAPSRVRDFPWNEPPEPQGVDERLAAVFTQQDQLRDELAGLRAEMSALREEFAAYRKIIDLQVDKLEAAQHVAPIYGDAMQLAMAGYDAGAIAERCGIARAEAELVVALVRNRGADDAMPRE